MALTLKHQVLAFNWVVYQTHEFYEMFFFQVTNKNPYGYFYGYVYCSNISSMFVQV